MAQKEALRGMSIIMIALVLSIPFYSANVLAVSVQITKNAGDDGIDGFLDAGSDTWHVEALIADAPAAVNAEEVKIVIGNSQIPFSSCSSSALGMVLCRYANPLLNGVSEGAYPFQVAYNYRDQQNQLRTASAGSVVTADGSAPLITAVSARQQRNDVIVDFTATEQLSGSAVGLKLIEILDGDSDAVLQTISEAEGKQSYSYVRDGAYGGKLQAQLTGEGTRRIKIRAEDLLGHSATSNVVSFRTDFVVPDIIEGSMEFSAFGQYIGAANAVTDIKVDIRETGDFDEVTASSSQATNLRNSPAMCSQNATELELWHCLWQNVEILPQDAMEVMIAAVDMNGNRAEKAISMQMSRDNDAPILDFFGTERTFNSESYIGGSKGRLILVARDELSGIDKESILANLGAFGRSLQQAPDECLEEGKKLSCSWILENFPSANTGRVSLARFKDKVGNEGSLPELEIKIDRSGPAVDEIEVYGVSSLGEKGYFQSGDFLKINVQAQEDSGLVVLVNLNNVLMDAEVKFLGNRSILTKELGDGWQAFTQDDCERIGGAWDCSFSTDAIKSGPDAAVKLEIKVQDTAGNDAREWIKEPKNVRGTKGKYEFELLGVDTEEHPDYWELQGRVRNLLDFVDLDTVQLTYARMPVTFKLRSSHSQAELVSSSLQGCAAVSPEAPDLSRSLVYGGIGAGRNRNPTVNLVLEFSPFDGKALFGIADKKGFDKETVDYTCNLLLFSKIGRNALDRAEVQNVTVSVDFAFSRLGAIDENLGKQITELKEDGFFKFASAISFLSDAFKIVQFLSNIIQIIVTINQFVNLFTEDMASAALAAKAGVITDPLYPVLTGTCFTAQFGQMPAWEFVKTIQIPVQILSCNPTVFGTGEEAKEEEAKEAGVIDVSGMDVLGFYGWWQRQILDTYNVLSMRDALGFPATSLYENIYTSAFGLCIPGIIYNIEKAREIHCRKIVCYGREVPAGIATVAACNDLYDLQMCEYVFGPLVELTPIGGLAYIGKLIKAAFTSPLGLISLAEIVGCASLCFKPTPGEITACKIATGINKALTIINSVISSVDNAPYVTGSPYCEQAEEINAEDLITIKSEEEPVTEA